VSYLRNIDRAFVCVVAIWLLPALSTSAAAQGLTVAAASDLQAALPAIAAQFEKDTGRKVSLTFGSSGNFFTQLQNGAPFDVFLSADVDYPRRLESAGLTERGTLIEYARGHIVVWTRRDSAVDISRGLQALTDSRVRRIAIANPEHAPYGQAAVAALKGSGIYETVKGKFVTGENISQAAQFAQSGSADVGLIALSLALTPALKDSGRFVEVPDALYPPIEQAAVVIAASRQKPVARQFVDALKTPAVMRILQTYGFATPAPAAR
jgi:molybdate transport system substrate-binding protein